MTDMLVRHFEEIFDIQYTARMEEELDEVEEGKLTWVEALDEFYKKFQKDLKKASKNMENLKAQEIPTDQICEKCGSPMVQKWGQFGSFLACSAYPECKNTKEIAKEETAGGKEATPTEQTPSRSHAKTAASPWPSSEDDLASSSRAPDIRNARPRARSRPAAGRRRSPMFCSMKSARKCKEAKLVVKDGRFGAVHLVQQLSEVQVHQAEDRWRVLPEVRMRRRNDRAAIQTWQGVLRLSQISRMRFRSLEQARSGASARPAARLTWSRRRPSGKEPSATATKRTAITRLPWKATAPRELPPNRSR